MNMRSLAIGLFVFSFVFPVAAQPVHQATPVDELMMQFHMQHRLISGMQPAQQAVDIAATKSFKVVASQFKFTVTPSPFVVNQGDSVSLDITSSDVGHGFFLEQYSTGAGITFGKNQHKTVSFVANVPVGCSDVLLAPIRVAAADTRR